MSESKGFFRVGPQLGKYVVKGRGRGRLVRPIDPDIQKKVDDLAERSDFKMPLTDDGWERFFFLIEEDHYKAYGPIYFNGRFVSSLSVNADEKVRVLREAEMKGYNEIAPHRMWDDLIRMVRPLCVSLDESTNLEDLLYTYMVDVLGAKAQFAVSINNHGKFEDMLSAIGGLPNEFDSWHGVPKLLMMDKDDICERIRAKCGKKVLLNSYNFSSFMVRHGFVKGNKGIDGVISVGNVEILLDGASGRVKEWRKVVEVLEQWMRLNGCVFETQEISAEAYYISGYFLLERPLNWSRTGFIGDSRVDMHPKFGDLFSKIYKRMCERNFAFVEGGDMRVSVASFISACLTINDRMKIDDFRLLNKDGFGYERFLDSCPAPLVRLGPDLPRLELVCGDDLLCVDGIDVDTEDLVPVIVDGGEVMCGPFEPLVSNDDVVTALVEDYHLLESVDAYVCDSDNLNRNLFLDRVKDLGYNVVEFLDDRTVGIIDEEMENFCIVDTLDDDDVVKSIEMCECRGVNPVGVLCSFYYEGIFSDSVCVSMTENYEKIYLAGERDGRTVMMLLGRKKDYQSMYEKMEREHYPRWGGFLERNYYLMKRSSMYVRMLGYWYKIRRKGGSVSVGLGSGYDCGWNGHSPIWVDNYGSCGACSKVQHVNVPGYGFVYCAYRDRLDFGNAKYVIDPPLYEKVRGTSDLRIEKLT